MWQEIPIGFCCTLSLTVTRVNLSHNSLLKLPTDISELV
jgi:hypothetical protein